MPRMTAPRLILALCIAAQCAAAVAAETFESLASLVGRDAALFVELRELDRHASELADSELGRRWQASGLADAFWSAPFDPLQKWQAVEAHVAAVTGAPFSEQLRALFAESVALALYLPSQGEPQGVLLARATSAESIDRVLSSWEKLELPLRTERRTAARGGQYFRRVIGRTGGERSLYFARHNRLFVLSDHEHLVRDCVDRVLDRSNAESLQGTVEYRGIVDRLHSGNWAVAYLNPRQWDAALARDAVKSPPSQKLLDAWKSFRAIAAGIHTTDGVHAELLVSLDEGQAGSEWREFAQAAALPSIVSSAPPRAVAVLGANVRLPWLVRQWERLLSTHDREGLEKGRRVLRGLLMGRDVLADVSPHVLGDWGVAIESRAPRDDAGAWWRAWDCTATSFLPAEMPRELRDGVDNALLFAMNMAAADRNNREETAAWHVERTDSSQGSRRVLVGPDGIEPAFAWLPGRLLLANHPELLDRPAFADEHSPLAVTAAHRFPDARIFAWLNLQQLREAFGNDEVRDPAPPSLAKVLRPLAQLGDQLFVAASWKESEVRFRAGMTIEAR